MTKEEIEKRKKEIDDELESLHEEQENLYDKIHTLQTEYCDLENEEILMNSKTKFESGKFYLLPENTYQQQCTGPQTHRDHKALQAPTGKNHPKHQTFLF